jgi:lipoic acid synthetase
MALDLKARKPDWLKVRAPGGERYTWIKDQRVSLELATVCEEARCPNIGECWSSGTATFMVMGDICTRGCRFCAVNTNRNGKPLDAQEPAKLARTILAMDLQYIVVTSVDRDDLEGQGAQHFADCVAAVNEASPKTRVEILHPDFRGDLALVDVVARSGADVLAHNIETVRRLTPRVRDRRCGYDQSLAVLARIKQTAPERFSKSSIMVGLGETEDEVMQCMRDLRAVDCDFLTVGQYLRPSQKHIAIEEYVTPEVFARYEQVGKELGFKYVASGPLVRSSYKAAEFFIHTMLEARDGAGEAPTWTPRSPARRRLHVIE